MPALIFVIALPFVLVGVTYELFRDYVLAVRCKCPDPFVARYGDERCDHCDLILREEGR